MGASRGNGKWPRRKHERLGRESRRRHRDRLDGLVGRLRWRSPNKAQIASSTIPVAGGAADAESAAEQVRAFGGDALVIKGDQANSADIARMIEAVRERFGRLDVLDQQRFHLYAPSISGGHRTRVRHGARHQPERAVFAFAGSGTPDDSSTAVVTLSISATTAGSTRGHRVRSTASARLVSLCSPK